MVSSGNTARSHCSSDAVRRASMIRVALPSRSPTVVLSWQSAMRRRRTAPGYRYRPDRSERKPAGREGDGREGDDDNMEGMDSLVSTAWLAEHLHDGDLRVLDC